MAKPYNKDVARMVEGFIDEKIAGEVAAAVEAAIGASLVGEGAIKVAIDAAIVAHETKAAGATFANSHVVTAG